MRLENEVRALPAELGLADRPCSLVLSSPRGRVRQQSGVLPGVGPVGPHTPMYVASVTKQLTALLAALAVRDGRLDPEDLVLRHRPDLPPWVAGVRVRHLVHHTSGLPEVMVLDGAVSDNNSLPGRLAARSGPASPAGREFSYSNTGYVTLALVVEAATGEPLPELARRLVFEPLALTDSSLGGPAVVRLPGHPDPPGSVGDGGWWASASDLDRWLTALDERFFGDDVGAVLETPGRLDDETPLDYAWGVRVTAPGGARTLSHGGSWPGWLAKTVRCPDRGVAAAVLVAESDDEAAVSELGLRLAALG